MSDYDKITADSVKKVRAAIAKVTRGEIYDSKGFVTKEGYEALETLEGLDLFWICDPDPLIKIVNKKEEV